MLLNAITYQDFSRFYQHVPVGNIYQLKYTKIKREKQLDSFCLAQILLTKSTVWKF